MATPTLGRHRLPGSLGEILVDLRTGNPAEPRPAVVIMHGFKGFKDWGMFPVLADRLARAGFHAVSFNVSGSGVDDAGEFSRPERFGRNTYSAELDDLHRVLDAVQSGTPLGTAVPPAIGLVGHSRGGGMAILETARNPAVAALVTWAAIADVDRWSEPAKAAWRRRGHVIITNSRTGQEFPLSTAVLDDIAAHGRESLNIEAAARRIAVPWLLIHGEADESVDPGDARRLAAAATTSRMETLFLPGAGHTFGATHPLTSVPEALDQVMTRTVNWMSRELG